ncbi:peptidylprolyl isomerase [Oscillatoria sp. FACHB-1407]|uniref:peptidylprolyl isomerase n=1 Tax=Oscillatoria sp. FACHB-1407 TaxID=2692847 RepID=UPI001687173F|nr:peptidylprolyl isomerase [Oscillatoria sp. FACHB-1407]MBD2464589.1 peptidylprolyl isomerase [Oscillatoria sp. FACHB-1407]
MSSEPFLTINDQPISLRKAFQYLQVNRKLDGFIGEIVRQFVIEQELESNTTLQIGSGVVEQAVIDFRLQQQLTDPKKFQEWLTANGLNYETFHNQIAYGFKVRKLKEDVTANRLQEYFIERKVFLDRVVLSRIIVADQELADELKSQILEGAKFEQLAREYSLTDDKVMNGMVGPVSRGTMPDILRSAIDLAKPGDVVGPLGMEGRWGLFRIEEILSATLDDAQVKQGLQDELFEQWLAERIQKLPIKLQVGE